MYSGHCYLERSFLVVAVALSVCLVQFHRGDDQRSKNETHVIQDEQSIQPNEVNGYDGIHHHQGVRLGVAYATGKTLRAIQELLVHIYIYYYRHM